MAMGIESFVERRLVQLFQHLSLEQVHIAGRVTADWHGLASTHQVAQAEAAGTFLIAVPFRCAVGDKALGGRHALTRQRVIRKALRPRRGLNPAKRF
jgi:hypothetical protein